MPKKTKKAGMKAVVKNAGKPRSRASRLRNFKCGEVYHIYQRGNHSRMVFLDDRERFNYLEHFYVLAKRHGVRLHNFALMGSHMHFMVEQTRVGAISNLMRDLQSLHARLQNLRLESYGNLWTQHFGCKHVDDNTYYRTLMWYIETNPVKSGRCKRAEDYPWTGARAHAANGPVQLTYEKRTLEVKLYLGRWRKVCQVEGWLDWVNKGNQANELAETVKKIVRVLDIESRKRFAREEAARLKKEAKRKRRKEAAMRKKFGPGWEKLMNGAGTDDVAKDGLGTNGRGAEEGARPGVKGRAKPDGGPERAAGAS